MSPYGLALAEDYLWSLTPREYEALRKEWTSHREHSDRHFATMQAMYYNMHFRGPQDAAWLPEDFLGTGDRTARQAQAQVDKMAVVAANRKLATMKPNQKPANLPEWAL